MMPVVPAPMHSFSTRHLKLLLVVGLSLASSLRATGQSYQWTTLAGSSSGAGFRDGPVGIAALKNPKAVATDPAGNFYLTDTGNHTIRKISPAGIVSTVAGKGGVAGGDNGSGSLARFRSPTGIARDDAGNFYIADTGNHTIRKINPTGGVTTLAGQAGVSGTTDGSGDTARFFSPAALTLASNGDLWVADTANHLIRKITPEGFVSTVAGQASLSGSLDGGPTVARLNSPKGISIDDQGTLYIADTNNRTIRKITADGNVTTLAGLAGSVGNVDAIGTAARFYSPEGILVDSARDIYVADARSIRKIAAADGAVTTFAGTYGPLGSADGTGPAARFSRPAGMTFTPDGGLLVADSGNNTLRKISPAAEVTTGFANAPILSGTVDGTGSASRFRSPFGLCADSGGTLHVADTGNRTVRRISAAGEVTTLAGTAGLTGTTDATGPDARFTSPRALAVGPGGVIHVADVVDTRNSTIRKISPAGVVSTLAGTPGTLPPAETLYFLTGVAVSATGNVFATDLNSLRKVTPAGVVSLFAGQKRIVFGNNGEFLGWYGGATDGTGLLASFGDPSGVAIDPAGNLFVADGRSCVIRKVTPASQTTTLAGLAQSLSAVSVSKDGTGSAARFNNPRGIAVDTRGTVYIADTGTHTIRKMSPDGVVTTIGGLPGYAGSGEGIGDRSLFNEPRGIAVDSSGIIYVADTSNHRIVKGVPLAVPDLVVEHPDGSHLFAGSPSVDLGSVTPGSTSPSTLLWLRNAGNAALEISGAELVGSHAAEFSFGHGVAVSLPANVSTQIRIVFKPTGQGPRTAILRIFSNSPEESPLEISLMGMGNTPPYLPDYAVSAQSGGSATISIAKLLATARDPEGDALTVTAVGWPGAHSGQIALQADSIRYTAPYFNFSGVETFQVTVTDARGASATGNVNVTVRSSLSGGPGSMATNPPKLTLLPGGKASVAFHGIPGRLYLIQRSLNLGTWENVANIVADTTGNVVFLDPAPPLPRAYYRIAIP